MTTIYLIRHGHKEIRLDNPSLTETGKQQALKTAERLSTIPLTVIYSSPMHRALETAKIIAQRISIPVIIHNNFKERMEWGTLPDQSFAEFLKVWALTVKDRHYQPKFGNSAHQTGKRMKKSLDDILTTYKNKHIAIVTHGGAIMDLLLNLFDENYLEKFKSGVSEGHSREILECSITTIIFDKRTYVLKELASIEHLYT